MTGGTASVGMALMAVLGLLAGCADGSSPASPAPPPAATPAPVPPTPTAPAPVPPAPTPALPCPGVLLEVAFEGATASAGIGRGRLTLRSENAEAALEFVRPYVIEVPEGGANLDVPGLRPTVGVFVSDLEFQPTAEGFRQTLTVEWLGELEVRAGAPGCEPVGVACDLAGCRGS